MSKENQKTAEAQAAATNQATVKVAQAQNKFTNTMAASGVSAAQITQDARTLVASPTVDVPKTITPTTVNIGETPANAQPQSAPKSVAIDPEMLVVLNAILETLRNSLAAESKQVENSEALIGLLKPRKTFESSEMTISRYLKRD